jgi:DHA1 family multidrug resistance protein-like MFS transporter
VSGRAGRAGAGSDAAGPATGAAGAGAGAGARPDRAASAPVRRRGSSLGEQTLLICGLIGAAQMTWGTIVPALPLYPDRFGATALVLGPIIAAFGVGRVLANIPAGLLLRWWKPRPYLWVVSLLLVVVTGLTGLAPDAGSLIAARVLAGVLGGAAITIGFAILVGGAPPARRGRVMATVTAVQMSAGAIGSFLGGLGLTWFPLEVVFLVAGVPLALVLAWDAARPAAHYWLPRAHRGDAPETPLVDPAEAPLADPAETPRADPASSPRRWSSLSRPRDPARRPTPGIRAAPGLTAVVIALALSSFATFFARFGGEQGLVPLAGYATGGLTPFTLGLALAAATLLSLAALPVVGALIDRGHRLTILVPGVLASAAALLLFPVADGPWLFALAIVLYGLATSVAGIVPTVLMSEAVPARQSGLVVGITRTAGDLGAVAGPLVALAVYDSSGLWPAVTVIVVLLLAANLSLARLLVGRRG